MEIKGHVLITGANGFVGRHLSNALLALGAKVSQLMHSSSSQTLEDQYIVDLTQCEKVASTFKRLQPNYVVHLAAQKSRAGDITDFIKTYDANVCMSLNVIHACIELKNLNKFIFLGSCDEYGLVPAPFKETQKEVPVNGYGFSKLAVTQLLKGLFNNYEFPAVVLRPAVVYGPDQGREMFISALIQSLVADENFAMTHGDQRRDFLYISDLVNAITRVMFADTQINGCIFNIGAGVSHQLKVVASLAATLIEVNAINRINFGAVDYRVNEGMDYSVDISLAKKLLGWYPQVSIEHGLSLTVSHFKNIENAKLAISK